MPESQRAVFLRHHVEDDPGLVGAALARRGVGVEVVTVDDDTDSVCLEGIAVLGILGSKWSVYDNEAVGGWFTTELAIIAEAHDRGIPVLGICFGAQALCVAFGGRVEPAPRVELGWVDLDANDDEGIPKGPWFQFHGDQCLVPDGAVVLARNDVCVQAFRVGRHLAVQFHPELDTIQFQRWLEAGAAEYCVSVGASPQHLLDEVARHEPDAARRTDELVEGFLRRAAT